MSVQSGQNHLVQQDFQDQLWDALNLVDEGVLIVDRDLRIVYANNRYVGINHLPPELVEAGLPVSAILEFLARRGEFGEGPVEQHVADRLSPVIDGSEWSYVRRLPDGQSVKVSGQPLPRGGYLYVFSDVSYLADEREKLAKLVEEKTQALQAARAAAEALAHTDSLTGLSNRRAFFERGRLINDQFRRFGHIYSVAILDIDHFKAINDTHGHATGDEAIKALADMLATSVRDVDIVGRIGGEEFAMVLPQTSAGGAQILAERLRKRAAEIAITTRQGDLRFTVSLGLSEVDPETVSLDHTLEKADEALYLAKRQGRNRLAVYGGD